MQTVLEAARRTGFRWRCLSLLVLAVALTACATTGARDVIYVYQSDDNFVRLEPIEPGAPPNSHPAVIAANQLTRLLADLQVTGGASVGKAPVFLPQELETIVPPLVSALARAEPNQDVTFAVTAPRGFAGRFASKTLTTGRVFVSGDSLNLIFGVIQQPLDPEPAGYYSARHPIVPGTRSRRIDFAARIEPGSGRFYERRPDWLVFDGAAKPATSTPSAPPPASAVPTTPPASGAEPKPGGEAPSTPSVDSKAQEIENKLRVLDALRKRGAITEQEYQERRRAVLEQL